VDKAITNKKLQLAVSIFILLYWLLCKTIDVYKYAILGVLSEILWLPMVVLLFLLPIINLYAIFKNKNSLIHYLNLALNLITGFFVFVI
jgi:hypothetical protein